MLKPSSKSYPLDYPFDFQAGNFLFSSSGYCFKFHAIAKVYIIKFKINAVSDYQLHQLLL